MWCLLVPDLESHREETDVNKDVSVQAPSLTPFAWAVEMCSFVLLPQSLSCWVEATAASSLCRFFLVLKDSPACRTMAVWASLWGEPQLSGALGDSWTLRLSACPSPSPSIPPTPSMSTQNHTELANSGWRENPDQHDAKCGLQISQDLFVPGPWQEQVRKMKVFWSVNWIEFYYDCWI